MAKKKLESKQRGGRSISITIPQHLFDKLNNDATAREVSFSRMVNHCVKMYYGQPAIKGIREDDQS